MDTWASAGMDTGAADTGTADTGAATMGTAAGGVGGAGEDGSRALVGVRKLPDSWSTKSSSDSLPSFPYRSARLPPNPRPPPPPGLPPDSPRSSSRGSGSGKSGTEFGRSGAESGRISGAESGSGATASSGLSAACAASTRGGLAACVLEGSLYGPAPLTPSASSRSPVARATRWIRSPPASLHCCHPAQCVPQLPVSHSSRSANSEAGSLPCNSSARAPFLAKRLVGTSAPVALANRTSARASRCAAASTCGSCERAVNPSTNVSACSVAVSGSAGVSARVRERARKRHNSSTADAAASLLWVAFALDAAACACAWLCGWS
mmetsp:Transcript_16169/g.41216  ORF Transcript_16169/g.41216 Transcript_16169/m.41216 type:complete len:322 (+) Transcript_16169:223-1188(+)